MRTREIEREKEGREEGEGERGEKRVGGRERGKEGGGYQELLVRGPLVQHVRGHFLDVDTL